MKKNMKIKTIYIFALLIITTVFACGASKKTTPIKWETSLDMAMKQAKAKDQIIMIDVYTEWCTWCKELDEKTYKQKDVVALAKKMVSLKLNPEESEDGALIAQKFAVTGYPTILFINADGVLLNRVGGYVEGAAFLPYIEKALSEKDRIETILTAKEPSMDKLNIYLESGDLENAKKVYGELETKKLLKDSDMASILLGFGLTLAQKQNYEEASVYFNDIINKYPNSEERNMAEYYTAVTFIVQGKINESKAYIDSKLKSTSIKEDLKKEYENLLKFIEENAVKK